MGMRFYWVHDYDSFAPGKLNLADYWTKHHPALHHRHVRSKFTTKKMVLEELKQRLENRESDEELENSICT